MPRIFFVILFVILALAPFPVLWITQALFGKPAAPVSTTKTATTSSNYGSYNHHHHHGGGWFIFTGNSGKGGWLGNSYRKYGSSKTFTSTSRSYKGGSSSFSGGSFGSFGK